VEVIVKKRMMAVVGKVMIEVKRRKEKIIVMKMMVHHECMKRVIKGDYDVL